MRDIGRRNEPAVVNQRVQVLYLFLGARCEGEEVVIA